MRIALARPKTAVAAIIAVAAAAAVVLGMQSTHHSGAYFSDSKTGHVSASVGTLGVTLSDNHSTAGNLVFNNIAPGADNTDVLKVTNTGSLDGDLSVTGLSLAGATWNKGPKGNYPSLAEVQNDILLGVDGKYSMAPASTYALPVDLGVVPAGATVSFTIHIDLSATAGNDWQGVGAANVGVVYTLNQVH